MALIRPRLTDHYNVPLLQDEADFAIPFLDEDIPFCVDPFLLWKSPSMQDKSLYAALSNSFSYLGHLTNTSKTDDAKQILIAASACEEVGLGFSGTRREAPIGSTTAEKVLSLFRDIPQVKSSGFVHFEEIQLFVNGIGRDRISDITCNFLKSFLIDFTMDQCGRHHIPTEDVDVDHVYDLSKQAFVQEHVKLPVNPITNKPTILVPKRWLRIAQWINYSDYLTSYYLKEVVKDSGGSIDRVAVLNFNRRNYDLVEVYIKAKERVQADCRNDPLFNPIPISSATRKIQTIRKLPTGRDDNADKKYEDLVVQIMASLLYPQLDFAGDQSRTDSGVLIRDLIFYNNRSTPFLRDIHDDYGSRQIVMELKNVKTIERQHINQLNRYLADSFGKFGILVTRNRLPSAMLKNTIDLWAGQRRCIIALSDEDMVLMGNVFRNKQRLPIDVIQAKYVQFTRICPS